MNTVSWSGEGSSSSRVRWGTAQWRADAERWAAVQLAVRGVRATGPMRDLSIQPWSAVWRIQTTGGSVVLKQTTPGRAAEIGAHRFCAEVAPDHVDQPLAHDPVGARLLFTDGGPTLHDTDQRDSLDVAARVISDYAGLQRATVGHDERAEEVGISIWDPVDAVEEVEWQVGVLHAMPSTDIRNITSSQRDQVRGRLDTYRCAADVLARSGVPRCIDHGDLWPGNVLMPVEHGHFRFIDFGDSTWTHPFLSVLPFLHYYHLRSASTGPLFDIEHSNLRYLTNAYLRAWTEYGRTTDLATQLAAAMWLAPLRRSRAAIMNIEHAGPEDEHELGPTPWTWLTLLHKKQAA